VARCLVPASTLTVPIPKNEGLTQPKKLISTASRIAELILNNCKQHRASPNANSTTANNIAHRRTPTLQLQSTSRIAKHQFYNCNQHLASLNANTVVMAYTWFVPSLVP
jgi:hypothetical protein